MHYQAFLLEYHIVVKRDTALSMNHNSKIKFSEKRSARHSLGVRDLPQ